LIVAPWNYPFQLLINPLVGAVSAGCCAVLKPSPNTPQIAAWMEKMVKECFDPAHVSLVQGGRETNQLLFEQRFDTIFFTGSPKLGRVVMEAASKHLTPVILELGGKSPCVVDASANISLAAKRIAWGKTINAGQTCIAPDYLFVHEQVKDTFIAEYKKQLLAFFGENPKESAYYPKIVNREALERLVAYLSSGTIIHGGAYDLDARYLSPTLIEDVSDADPIMQDEIFGPILPIMTFRELSEVIEYVNAHEKPLAAYYFGSKKAAQRFIDETSSGGVCINDVLLHIANHGLPFGGVGNSGMGSYHGYRSFEAFSHPKSVLRSSSWFDLPVKYVPFKFFSWIKKIL
jgi:aldehyde dehydrogenase (NAD+)